MARFVILHEARVLVGVGNGGWHLCLQWGELHHGGDWTEEGYRFIYRDDSGKQQPYRGQARMPSLKKALELIDQAEGGGWGDSDTGE